MRNRRDTGDIGRRTIVRWRQLTGGSRLTDLAHEPLELHRSKADQGARRLRARRNERVRDVLRAEREPAGSEIQARVADIDRQLAVEP